MQRYADSVRLSPKTTAAAPSVSSARVPRQCPFALPSRSVEGDCET